MDWNVVEGKWEQFKGRVQERWGKISNDDVDMIQGRRQYLLGKIQEHYGMAKEEAERQIDDFLETLH